MKKLPWIPVLLLVGCDKGYQAERFFGSDVWTVMEVAERLEAFRLAQSDKHIDGKRYLRNGVRIVGPPADPGENWLKIFAVVEDPWAYDWKKPVVGKPQPEVVYRFSRGEKNVDLLVCFASNAVSLDWSNSTNERNWVDITPARKEYVQLAQKVFDLDQFIQSLKTGEPQLGPMEKH